MKFPLDPENYESGATEYSWGPGLTPKGLEHEPPSEGGMYQGKAPEMQDPVIGTGKA